MNNKKWQNVLLSTNSIDGCTVNGPCINILNMTWPLKICVINKFIVVLECKTNRKYKSQIHNFRVRVMSVEENCQQYSIYIVRGHRSTKRKPPTCCKSLTNLITLSCIQFTPP